MKLRPLENAYINFCDWLSIATQFDLVKYANWLRDNELQITIGFDRYLRDNEKDLLPEEHRFEMPVYGRMQYSRAMGLGV